MGNQMRAALAALVLAVIALLLTAGRAGSAEMTTKVVTTLSDPFIVEAGKTYLAEGAVLADANGVATYSDSVNWYDGTGDGTISEAVLSNTVIASGAVTTSWQPYRARVTAPAGAKYARRVPVGTITTGGGHGVKWAPFGWQAAVTGLGLAPNLSYDSTLSVTGALGTVTLSDGGVQLRGNGITSRYSLYDQSTPPVETAFIAVEGIADDDATLHIRTTHAWMNITSSSGMTFASDAIGGVAEFLLPVTMNSSLSAASVSINSGPSITGHRSATAALNFSSIAANSTSELTITVTGAAVGDSVTVTPSGAPESGLVWAGYVSATNTVTVRLANVTTGAIDPASRTYRADVWQH